MFLPYEVGKKMEWAVTLQQAVFLVGDLLPLARTKLKARHEFGGSPQADVKVLPSPFHALQHPRARHYYRDRGWCKDSSEASWA